MEGGSIHKGEPNPCNCGCLNQLQDGDEVVIVTHGVVNFRDECFDDMFVLKGTEVYLVGCWEKLHPKNVMPPDCGASGRWCRKQNCAIWDKEEHRCALLSIAINTKRI